MDTETGEQAIDMRLRLPIPGTIQQDQKLPSYHTYKFFLHNAFFQKASSSNDYTASESMATFAKEFFEITEYEIDESTKEFDLTYSVIVMRDYHVAKQLDLLAKARDTAALSAAMRSTFD